MAELHQPFRIRRCVFERLDPLRQAAGRLLVADGELVIVEDDSNKEI